MNIENRIREDFMKAYKSKQKDKKDFLGLILSDIASESFKDNGKSESEVIKSFKKSLEQINTDQSKVELEWLSEYLPKTLSPEQTEIIVNQYFHDAEDHLKNMRSVMQYFKSIQSDNLGLVDMKLVSKLAKEKLS